MTDTEGRVVYIQRRLVLTPRTCAQCGRAFEGWGRQRFCQPKCQKLWDYYKHADARRATRRERYRRQKHERAREGN
jgi:hypothetical protein